MANALPGAAEIDKLLRGIPQHRNVLGRPTAPTTLVEYVDLQCPFCQEFETQAMPALIKLYVRTGKTKVELRPVAFIGADSQLGRSASSSRAGAGLPRGAFASSSPPRASNPEGFTSPLRRPASSAARPSTLTAAARNVEEIRSSTELLTGRPAASRSCCA